MCIQNLKFIAFPVPEKAEIIGVPKNLSSTWIRPRSLFSKFLYSTLILGVFPLHQIAHVGDSVSRALKLFGREIIFEVFQHM